MKNLRWWLRGFGYWLRDIEHTLRLIEVAALVTGAFFIGFLTLLHDEERNRLMEGQTDAQHRLNHVIELRSNTGVVAALLSHFCSEKEMHRVISVIINTKASENPEASDLMRAIDENCQETLGRLGVNLRQTEMEAAYNLKNKRFLDAVSAGRLFHDRRLWDSAVEYFSRAADDVPPFLPNGMIQPEKIEAAKKETDVLTKADLFKEAFAKVP